MLEVNPALSISNFAGEKGKNRIKHVSENGVAIATRHFGDLDLKRVA